MIYEKLLAHILTKGEPRNDRTGTGTISVFSPPRLEYDCSEQFPLLTSKKVHWKSVLHEFLWFLRGDTNVKYLRDNGVTIWDEWADEDGEIGPMYGYQLTYPSMSNCSSQIESVMESLSIHPHSRRHVMTTWNYEDMPEMALAPCHGIAIQFYVSNDGYLDLHMYQRSADMFLGVPFNIASYALMLYVFAWETNYKPRMLYMTLGDAHIYNDHIPQVEEQLTKTGWSRKDGWKFKEMRFPPMPTLKMADEARYGGWRDYKFEHFILEDYNPWPPIKAKVSI